MPERSLLQQLEDLARKVKSLEREKAQAIARSQQLEREKSQDALTMKGLEREVAQLGIIIAKAADRVEEMLKENAASGDLPPEAGSAPSESKRHEKPERPSKPADLNLKWRFPHQRQTC